MDGKKRIARLRNAEKWKRLGFRGIPQIAPVADKIKGMQADLVVIDDVIPGEVQLQMIVDNGRRKKKKAKRLGQAIAEFAFINAFPFAKKAEDSEKKSRFANAHRMIDALEKKGFKVLGAGHYSTVLAHPKCSDKVIKVTRTPDNWIDYVKWAAEKGYAGGFAPRVYSWKKFPSGWSWAVMERMERTLDSGYDWRDSDDEYSEKDYKGEHDFTLIFSLLSHARNGNTMAQVYIEDLAPGTFAFVKDLTSVMRAGDIRGANTMVRKDGSLCFTDPCAGTSKLTTTRIRSGDFPRSIRRCFICELLSILKPIGLKTLIRFG